MAWDYYTIVARKKQQGANQKLEIITVTRNGDLYNEKPGNEKPNFQELEAPDLVDCVYMGGTEKDPDKDACRWLWGRWW